MRRTSRPPGAKKEAAIEAQEFEKAANLRDKERQLTNKKRASSRSSGAQRESGERPEIAREEITDIVSTWTGIPVFKLTEAETQKWVAHGGGELHKRVIGQDCRHRGGLDMINARAGPKDPGAAHWSSIFLGPRVSGRPSWPARWPSSRSGRRGDGATNTSEYMDKHSVSRLVGSPPATSATTRAVSSPEAAARKLYSVLLLDETRRNDVFNILLQILEHGRLTDAQGRTVDFRNSIVIKDSERRRVGDRQEHRHRVHRGRRDGSLVRRVRRTGSWES